MIKIDHLPLPSLITSKFPPCDSTMNFAKYNHIRVPLMKIFNIISIISDSNFFIAS